MGAIYTRTLKGAFFILLFFLVLWQIISFFNLIDEFWLPAPYKFFSTVYIFFSEGIIQKHILITVKRLLLGFLLGSISGLLVSYICCSSRKIRFFLEPLIYITFPIPRFAVLPFIILIFGTGMSSKIIFIALAAFFPVTINTIKGITEVNTNFSEVALHYGAKGFKLFTRVIFPGSLQSAFVGLRISLGMSLAYVTVIEYLSAMDGIGAMLWMSLQILRIDQLLLGILIITMLSIILISLLTVIEKLAMPWVQRNDRDAY
ncbi:MAG: ABC transporter permease [Candidatus Omnitrophota bacterium]